MEKGLLRDERRRGSWRGSYLEKRLLHGEGHREVWRGSYLEKGLLHGEGCQGLVRRLFGEGTVEWRGMSRGLVSRFSRF